MLQCTCNQTNQAKSYWLKMPPASKCSIKFPDCNTPLWKRKVTPCGLHLGLKQTFNILEMFLLSNKVSLFTFLPLIFFYTAKKPSLSSNNVSTTQRKVLLKHAVHVVIAHHPLALSTKMCPSSTNVIPPSSSFCHVQSMLLSYYNPVINIGIRSPM